MFFSIDIAESPTKPNAKEPEERWLYRVCGVPFGMFFTLIAGPTRIIVVLNGTILPFSPVLSPTAERAVRSWVHAAQETAIAGVCRTATNCRAGLIISDPFLQRFLLTKKDGTHPNPKFRHKFGYVGGSLEPGESAFDGMLRELYEEVRDVHIADQLAALASFRPLGGFELTADAMQGAAGHTVSGFAAVARDTRMFARWHDAFMHDGPASGLSEGEPVLIRRNELKRMLDEDISAPGSNFIGGLHVPLIKLLADHDAGAD